MTLATVKRFELTLQQLLSALGACGPMADNN